MTAGTGDLTDLGLFTDEILLDLYPGPQGSRPPCST